MIPLGPNTEWSLVEALVISWLNTTLTDPPIITTETGEELGSTVFTLIRVNQIPGGFSDGLNQEVDVDVQCFGPNRAAMWTLAQHVHTAMCLLPSRTTPYGVVDDLDPTPPGESPYGNPLLRRTVATYRLTTRVRAAA